MSDYRRLYVDGGTYFITQVTYQREPWLCTDSGRKALREAIEHTRQKYPFSIDAFVLLPDHFHLLLTLPDDDRDFSVRLRLMKTFVSKYYAQELGAIARFLPPDRNEAIVIFGRDVFGSV